MSEIGAGFWPCRVLDGFYGDNDKDIPIVRINVEVTDGPWKGTRQTYEEAVNNKQAPYIARTCAAVGWQKRSLRELQADVAAWIAATGGLSTVEIKHIEMKKGKKFEKWHEGGCHGPAPIWAKANSIGRGPKPLKESSQQNLAEADEALLAALAADEAGSGGGGGNYDAPPDDFASHIADADIPF